MHMSYQKGLVGFVYDKHSYDLHQAIVIHLRKYTTTDLGLNCTFACMYKC